MRNTTIIFSLENLFETNGASLPEETANLALQWTEEVSFPVITSAN